MVRETMDMALLNALLPVTWPAAQVHDRDNLNSLVIDLVENAIGKSLQEVAPNSGGYRWPGHQNLLDDKIGLVKLLKQILTQSLCIGLKPKICIPELLLDVWMEAQGRHSAFPDTSFQLIQRKRHDLASVKLLTPPNGQLDPLLLDLPLLGVIKARNQAVSNLSLFGGGHGECFMKYLFDFRCHSGPRDNEGFAACTHQYTLASSPK